MNRFYPIRELVEIVQEHAMGHYGVGGWDVIVECYDDEMIKDLLQGKGLDGKGRVRTPKAAVRRIAEVADLIGSVRDDIRSA